VQQATSFGLDATFGAANHVDGLKPKHQVLFLEFALFRGMALALCAWASIRQEHVGKCKVVSRLGGGLVGYLDPKKQEQSLQEYAQQVAMFGAEIMPHERGYTWRSLDVEFVDSKAEQASIMWSEQKAMEVAKNSHNARVVQDGVVQDGIWLCVSFGRSPELVPEIGAFYKETKCFVSGVCPGSVVDLDGISCLARLHELCVERICFRASRLPSSLGALHLTGATIEHMVVPSMLKELRFHASTFGRTTSLEGIVKNLKALVSLQGIQSTNLLEIPTELGGLVTLKFLYLMSNKTLTGKIPSELGLLTNLADLSLRDNLLSGQLPLELGNLARLRFLDVRYNLLTNTIPTELGKLKNLETFQASYNNLTGSLPDEIIRLTKLTELDVSHNQLIGLTEMCLQRR
jgi:hypothetical protein